MGSDSNSENNILLLVPTQLELDFVSDRIEQLSGKTGKPHLCGFGPIAAAVETSRLLSEHSLRELSFNRVVLIGIAGSYDLNALPIGTACQFRRAGCFGVGAFKDETFLFSKELGLPQLRLDQTDCFDELSLSPMSSSAETADDRQATRDMLLTVFGAAGNQDQVISRLGKFPGAVAEDMEAFAVAMAAARFQTPATVIRGISNAAGDRNVGGWDIEGAMHAALDLLADFLD